jgi:hypothetical protein
MANKETNTPISQLRNRISSRAALDREDCSRIDPRDNAVEGKERNIEDKFMAITACRPFSLGLTEERAGRRKYWRGPR